MITGKIISATPILKAKPAELVTVLHIISGKENMTDMHSNQIKIKM